MNCPFTSCGGCSLINSDPTAVFSEKTAKLAALLSQDLSSIKLVHSPEKVRYRSRVLLRYHPSPNQLGYFAEGSRDLVDIKSCIAATKPLDEFMAWLRETPFNNKPKDRYRLLVQQTITERVTVHVVGDNGITDELELFRQHLNDSPLVEGATAPQSKPLDPVAYDEQDGLTFHFSPSEFRQANESVNRILRALINDLCVGAASVTDLYGGSGNLSLLVAKSTPVKIFEHSAEAPRSCTKNLSVNRIDPSQLGFNRVDLSKTTPALSDTVVLDPPRRGADLGVLQSILEQKPRRVFYLSCHPLALKQDLVMLGQRYKIDSVWNLDMMPGTDQIETLVSLNLM